MLQFIKDNGHTAKSVISYPIDLICSGTNCTQFAMVMTIFQGVNYLGVSKWAADWLGLGWGSGHPRQQQAAHHKR